MSELRIRIAAVLTLHQRRDSQHCLCGWGQLGHSHADHQADAVIRELKLEAEDGECGYCHAQLPGCRYSTWKADDE
jgi:hypothetical protein